MPSNSIDLPTDSISLLSEYSRKLIPGFVKVTADRGTRGQFAKALASALLKFTTEGKRLSKTDSVLSFIELAGLYRDLAEQAQVFLQEEIPFIYEDQPLQPVLLSFAAFRLKHVSRRYYFAMLQNQPQAILEDLRDVIRQRQQEYDELLQAG